MAEEHMIQTEESVMKPTFYNHPSPVICKKRLTPEVPIAINNLKKFATEDINKINT